MKINRNLIFLIVFLAFFGTLFLGRQIFFPPQKKLQLISTLPSPGQKNVPLNQEITLEFNQAVSVQDFTFSFLPETPIETKEENQKIIIKPKKDLLPKTQYYLEIKDMKGNSFFTLTFQTNEEKISPSPSLSMAPSFSPPLSPPEEASSEGKGNPKAKEEINQKLYQDYPLYNSVPYHTATWYTDYAAPEKLLIIYRKGEDLPVIQEEVFAWIRENNVDPKTHLYIWEERETLPQ